MEYNGCTMKPEDWATVQPFTDLFVNFFLIQQGGQSRVVRCPWCTKENPLSSVSGSEESATKWYVASFFFFHLQVHMIIASSCSECGRDFSAAVGSSMGDGGDQYTPSLGLNNTISVEICRFRIRLQSPDEELDSNSEPRLQHERGKLLEETSDYPKAWLPRQSDHPNSPETSFDSHRSLANPELMPHNAPNSEVSIDDVLVSSSSTALLENDDDGSHSIFEEGK